MGVLFQNRGGGGGSRKLLKNEMLARFSEAENKERGFWFKRRGVGECIKLGRTVFVIETAAMRDLG